jgi:hypothetical protein
MTTRISKGQLDQDVIDFILAQGGTPSFAGLTGNATDNASLAGELNGKWDTPANSATLLSMSAVFTAALKTTYDNAWATPANAAVLTATEESFTTAYKASLDGLHTVASTGLYSDLESTDKPVYRLTNFTATDDPDANDDTGAGYGVGSPWYNVTDDTAWLALDVTAATAVWKQIDAVQVSDKADNGITTGITIWKGTAAQFAAITPAANQLSIVIG